MEQSKNSRPITPVSPNSTELKALTPNHFLLDEHSVSFPSLTFVESFYHRKRCMRSQAYANVPECAGSECRLFQSVQAVGSGCSRVCRLFQGVQAVDAGCSRVCKQ